MKKIKLLLLIFLTLNLYSSDIDFDKIIKQSKEQNKQIMVFFHMKHCPWCHKMIDDSLKDENIMNQIKKDFIYVSIDVENKNKLIYNKKSINKIDFARKYNIHFYPTTLMFDDMIVVQRIRGYRNKQKFENIVKYIATKSNKNMTLKEFIVDLEFEK